MQQVAQPWLILSMSHSSFLVGVDSFVLNAPAWMFTLWGGVLADRVDRKKLILSLQFLQFICVVILLGLLVWGRLQVWILILISFFIGSTDALSMPSFQSIIPSLVKPAEIPRAIALNATQFNLSRILGPIIAGLVMARFGAVACFGANAFSYVPFFISVFWMFPRSSGSSPIVHTALPPNSKPSTHWRDYKRLLKTSELRAPLTTIFITSLFCGPLVTFCPVLIRDVFHADVGEFGGAMAAFGFGGLIGAGLGLILASARINRGRFATFLGMTFALLVVLISLNRSLIALSVLMVLAGIALTTSNIAASSFLQENTNNHSRGKVVSLFQLALQGGLSLGGLLMGLTSAQLGVSRALMVSGVIAIVLQGGVLLRYRSIK